VESEIDTIQARKERAAEKKKGKTTKEDLGGTRTIKIIDDRNRKIRPQKS